MKAKFLLPLLFSVVLFSEPVLAQPAIEMICTSKQEYISEARKRQWVVELLQEDPQMLKQLKKFPKDLEKYRTGISAANAVMQEVIMANWAITGTAPEFKSKEEVSALLKGPNSENYALLILERYKVETVQSVNRAGVKPVEKAPVEEATLTMRLAGGSYRHLGAVNLPEAVPTKAQMMMALQLLQNTLNVRQNSTSPTAIEDMLRANGQLLKSKTLLVAKQDLKRGLTLEQIKTVYPYEIKIADRKEIEEAVSNKSKEYAYVQTLPSFGAAKTMQMQLVVDAEDGKLLGRSVPSPVAKRPVRKEVSPNNFKDYLEMVKQ